MDHRMRVVTGAGVLGRVRLAGVGITDIAMRRLAGQLSHPRGVVAGRVMGAVLNRVNRGPMTGSIAALEVKPGQTVADVGFGGGLGLSLLLEQVGPDGRVYGVDMSTQAIADARRRFRGALDAGRLHLVQATMDAIALPDNTLDAAATVNTIYYLSDAQIPPALSELARVLRPGGRLVLGLGDPEFMATMPWSVGPLRLRPIADIEAALVAAGFTLTGHGRVGASSRAFHTLTAETPRGQ